MATQTTRSPLPPETIATETPVGWDTLEPNIDDIEIEDGRPVDNIFSEKQQRFLVTSIYSDRDRQPLLAAANVGLFYARSVPPLVPDILLSLGISVPEDWTEKKNRSYFVWNFGKPPEVAIEIVSNKEGNELGSKLKDYVTAGVGYYIVYDPLLLLGDRKLRVFARSGTQYQELNNFWLSDIDLGLTFWEGEFEGKFATWLRWCDRDGNILPTGDERAKMERQRAETERQRAETEQQRAETERQRAEIERQRADRLAQKLQDMGIDPNEL